MVNWCCARSSSAQTSTASPSSRRRCGATATATGWLADALEAERAVDPQGLTIVVVEAGSEVICAGWVRFEGGSEFATLWGGATLPAWRGRGIYRATVAYRAALATERGYRLIEVDASADSRPILERLGLVAVTTTTPYVWSPPSVPALMA